MGIWCFLDYGFFFLIFFRDDGFIESYFDLKKCLDFIGVEVKRSYKEWDYSRGY